jgi:hypothetical protein
MTTHPNSAATADFTQPQTRALGVGVAGLALCALGWLTNPEQFYRSYLLGYLLTCCST